MPIVQSRRRLLTNLGAAGVAGLGGLGAVGFGSGIRSFAAEAPPEITTLRLERFPGVCLAPSFMVELLRSEGFNNIAYIEMQERDARPGGEPDMVARGELDFLLDFAPDAVMEMDAGGAVTVLTGVHAGCFELLASANVRSIADLKHRSVGIGFGYTDLPLLTVMMRLLGLDPHNDSHL